MVAARFSLFGGRLLEVHACGVPSQRGGELGGDFACAFGSDVRAGTGLRDGVAEPADFAGFRMNTDGDLFLVERLEISRRPDLHGTVALEQGRRRAHGEALQEVLAGQRVGAVPMSGGESDVLEGGGVELARFEERVRGGARLIAG